MTKSETIWNRARTALMLPGHRGEEDVFLFEHASRVAHAALEIAKFPEAVGALQEQTSLLAAALFLQSAWAVRCRQGECTRAEVLTKPLSPNQREASLSCMSQALNDVVVQPILERAARVMLQVADRGTALLEARILADAETLEEASLLSLWPSIRRGAIEGRGVQSQLDQWHRRKEYQFWTGRFKDRFHFVSVRDLAVKRLTTYEKMMEQLNEQQQGSDLKAAATVSSARSDSSFSAAKAG